MTNKYNVARVVEIDKYWVVMIGDYEGPDYLKSDAGKSLADLECEKINRLVSPLLSQARRDGVEEGISASAKVAREEGEDDVSDSIFRLSPDDVLKKMEGV